MKEIWMQKVKEPLEQKVNGFGMRLTGIGLWINFCQEALGCYAKKKENLKKVLKYLTTFYRRNLFKRSQIPILHRIGRTKNCPGHMTGEEK